MISRKPSIICLADEKQIAFLTPFEDGRFSTLACLPLDSFMEGTVAAEALPKSVRQAIRPLLVMPDYWIGNSFHDFQSRKKKVVTAFIERKLRLDQPTLSDAVAFYSHAMVQGEDRRQLLCTTYLQEPVAYRLYRRLESLGIHPRRMTTPALIWQARLAERIHGFADKGVGFVHLAAGDCFLYFFYQGQFLFSRHIQLPDAGDDDAEVYNLLNYEINQSFYLYSQKTKSAVQGLYMLAPDATAAHHLSDLLGREVSALPSPPSTADLSEAAAILPACMGFTLKDLISHMRPAISHKPLQKELFWRPVQWAGMAVGILLAVMLVAESGYLHVRSAAVERTMVRLKSSASEPPDIVLGELSQILDEITAELARPSGSGSVMRTMLAMPASVSLKKLSLDASSASHLSVDAVIDADHPDAFKAVLDVFLERINDRFNLQNRPLREKDVTIQLQRLENDERKALYLIHFGFEII